MAKYTNRDSIKDKIREITISTYVENTGKTEDFTEALQWYWGTSESDEYRVMGTEETFYTAFMLLDYYDNLEEEFELDIKLIEDENIDKIIDSDKDADQSFEDFVDFICDILNIN